MSDVQVQTAVAGALAVPKKLNAIQLIEQKLGEFFKQREQALANLHAVDGGIQATQHLLATLRVEAAKGEAVVEPSNEKGI